MCQAFQGCLSWESSRTAIQIVLKCFMPPILYRSQSPGYHRRLQTRSIHLRLRPLPLLYVAMAFCSPETCILFFEFVCFIFCFYILSFNGTENMCQCIHKCTIPLDLKIPLTSIFQKLIATFNLVLSSHLFYLSCELILLKFFIHHLILVFKRRGHIRSYLSNCLSGLTLV